MKRIRLGLGALAAGIAGVAAFLVDIKTLMCGGPCWPEQVGPVVATRIVETSGGGECLEFAFTRLPDDFALRTIRLNVVNARGPGPIGGDQAASPSTRRVNQVLGDTVFRGNPAPIELDEPLVAERRNDSAIVEFCPVLRRPGLSGKLWLDPSFIGLDGRPIEIEKLLEGKPLPVGGIPLSVSHPRGIVIEETEVFQGLIDK